MFLPSNCYAETGIFSSAGEADILSKLGLYNGTSTTTFNPDLGTIVDRETAIVMLIRLMGVENDALMRSDSEVAADLSKYTDKDKISSWAKKQIAYAVNTKLVVGTSKTTISPQYKLTGRQYANLIMRQLGYGDDGIDDAKKKLAESGADIHNLSDDFLDTVMTKNDFVGACYNSLTAKYKSGDTIIGRLLKNGVIDKSKTADIDELTDIDELIDALLNRNKLADDLLKKSHKDDSDKNDAETGLIWNFKVTTQGTIGCNEMNVIDVTPIAQYPNLLTLEFSDSLNEIKESIMLEVNSEEYVDQVAYELSLKSSITNLYDITTSSGIVAVTAKTTRSDSDVQITITSVYDSTINVTSQEIVAGSEAAYETAVLTIHTRPVNAGYNTIMPHNCTIYVSPSYTENQIANSIYNMLYDAYSIPGYDISISGNSIIYTSHTFGDKTDLSITIE